MSTLTANVRSSTKTAFRPVRYRFVFRNEPDDGAVARTTVLSIGPREDLAAYRRAATRRGRQRSFAR